VSLVFDEPDGIPTLHTDEAKVSQILRNFLSNALKFTERGEIRVSARLTPDGDAVVCSVADTGIGIAPEDQERIFEEFTQVDNPVQKRVRGTGLGLPLVRKLATLLGGTVSVDSTPGVGSTFSVTVPLVYPGIEDSEPDALVRVESADSTHSAILVVEDNPHDQLLYAHYFRQSPFRIAVARTLREARQSIARVQPRAVVLDIRLGGDDVWASSPRFARARRPATCRSWS
jgi:anti-sigma regulatory factor (Ser/Thr protein kinase)